MSKVSIVLRFFKIAFLNKYVIVFLLFLVYIVFFDHNNLKKKARNSREIIRLEEELNQTQKEIKDNKETLIRLQTDTVFLERFAREKYFMSKEGEDVFIFNE